MTTSPSATPPPSPSSPSPNDPPPSSAAALVRWFVLIGVTFAVLAFAFVWLSRNFTARKPIAGGGEEAGQPAPDFRLASLDGGVLGPPDFAGQVVVVDFWATWCGPCRVQAQILEKLHAELDGQGVQFLAVDVGEDADTVKDFVSKSPFPYPVLLDESQELSVRYQIVGLPTVMIVDREGKVSFLHTGIADATALRQAIEAAGGGGQRV